jgi:hypothetical protein
MRFGNAEEMVGIFTRIIQKNSALAERRSTGSVSDLSFGKQTIYRNSGRLRV